MAHQQNEGCDCALAASNVCVGRRCRMLRVCAQSRQSAQCFRAGADTAQNNRVATPAKINAGTTHGLRIRINRLDHYIRPLRVQKRADHLAIAKTSLNQRNT